ncbi:hypothetical protein AMTRI_Chr12g270780 [Amborella trichopoda]
MASAPNVPVFRKEEEEEEGYDEDFQGTGFCCFQWNCFGKRDTGVQEKQLLRNQGSKEEWWKKGWDKGREWSEILAGPKWKTFIRRLRFKKQGKPQYKYDPQSYALNFDGDRDDNSDGFLVGFPSRFPSTNAA